MDILYIPQLDEVSATGETAATRYRLAGRVPEGGTVALADKAITRIRADDASPLRLVVPPAVAGQARDFLVRIVVTTAAVPEVSFAAPTGEEVAFEGTEDGLLTMRPGVNVFSFTESDQGVFFLNRRQIDVTRSVSFETRGGSAVDSPRDFTVGRTYRRLPKTFLEDRTFAGWFTEPEGGVRVAEDDGVLFDVTRLYARWTDYVDVFVDSICPAKDLRFYTGGDADWRIDETLSDDLTPAARSGAVADGGSSRLWTYVEGPGTLAFRWKTSCEQGFDKLKVSVDGDVRATLSGWKFRFEDCSLAVTGEGRHRIEWTYEKDGTGSDHDDCGWVDSVRWTGEAH